jgi:uncharacterized iron-regulated protein
VKCIISWRNLSLGLFLTLAAGPVAAEQVFAEDLTSLPVADVVILGEVHDNPEHHQNQAVAVAAMMPKAIVFEMLSPEQASRMPVDRSDQTALERVLQWNASGWPEFSMYYPLFTAAPGAAIYGAEVPRADVRAALDTGAAAVFGADAARYGLDRPLDPGEQAARENEQQAVHCDALPADSLPGMVQAQQLRDAALARAVLMAHQATGGPIAVITGSGHARKDWGVPAVLSVAAPDLSVLSIGQVELDAGENPPWDKWLVTAAVERPDPCAAFGNGGGTGNGG